MTTISTGLNLGSPIAPPGASEAMDYSVALEQISLRQDAWRRFKRNRLSLAGMVVFALVIVTAIVSIFWTPYSLYAQGLGDSPTRSASSIPSASLLRPRRAQLRYEGRPGGHRDRRPRGCGLLGGGDHRRPASRLLPRLGRHPNQRPRIPGLRDPAAADRVPDPLPHQPAGPSQRDHRPGGDQLDGHGPPGSRPDAGVTRA